MLKIKNLSAKVDGKTILKGINLEVKPGEVHAIMGPNGSGKSTLASVIAGHEDYEVVKGSMSYQGEDLSEMDPESRSHKGIFLSFQYPVEIPGVSVTNFVKTAINATRKAFQLNSITTRLINPNNQITKEDIDIGIDRFSEALDLTAKDVNKLTI